MANDLGLPPVVPMALLTYIDQCSDKVNIAFKVGNDLVETFREIRTAAHNTQTVTLFSSLALTEMTTLAALYIPEWSYQHSQYAVARIVDNQVVEIYGPEKDELLFEIDVSSCNCKVVALFSSGHGEPRVKWFTPATFPTLQHIQHG